ncbi:MAG: AAA family ATPase [Nitrospiraceae bacterium]|nr:AAA family ATPase [Nitrospiraceae bacterium]
MIKKDIQRYLLDKKENIKELRVFSRDINLQLSKNFIVSVIGPRRAGKSYFLYDVILNRFKIEDKDYLFMNFEDAQLSDFHFMDIVNSVNLHEELYECKPKYIFLDEVQNVNQWDKAVRTLYESKQYYIFVSGSSSKLLSKEIATSLRGRSISCSVMPLSFKEFLTFNSFRFKKFYSTSEVNEIKHYLRTYVKNGGFPDVVLQSGFNESFFQNYVDLVVFRDIVERYNVSDVSLVRFLIKSLASSFSKPFSVNRIFNNLKSRGLKVSKNTLYNYVSYLQESFFVFLMKRFSYKLKDSELSIPKVYFNDTGLINFLSFDFSEDYGKLIENVVFSELYRRGYDTFYWKNVKQEEVDFVLTRANRIEQLLQVSYNFDNPKTKNRELKSLIKASKDLNVDQLYVINWDIDDTEEFGDKKIVMIPLWKWLLE